jgi:hypothetical protein
MMQQLISYQATRFGVLRVLAVAAFEETNFNTLSCLLSSMMNFHPTADNYSCATAPGAGVLSRLSKFLSCTDPGK